MIKAIPSRFAALTAVISVAALTGVFPAPALATPDSPAAQRSLVGTYAMTVTVGATVTNYVLKVRSFNGANDWTVEEGRVQGVWYLQGATITFGQYWPDHCAIFTGVQTKTGINSKAQPGNFRGCAGEGTWYAVRKRR